MDTAFWKQIIEQGYTIPHEHPLLDLTYELLGYLGSPDLALRNPAYNILEKWIGEKGDYAPAELIEIRRKALDNMRVGIGEAGTDSVFLRSFSVWVIGFLLMRDQASGFLTQAEHLELLDRVGEYAAHELDTRGWVDGKGWAHSTAHIASVLALLADSRFADAAIHARILDIIAGRMTMHTNHAYGYGEDDRMVQAVNAILTRGLIGMEVWNAWLMRLRGVMELAQEGMPFDIGVFHAYMNTRNFVRSLFFPMELCIPEKPALWAEFRPALIEAIKDVGLC